MDIKTLGIDIAKNICQVHGVDHMGRKEKFAFVKILR